MARLPASDRLCTAGKFFARGAEKMRLHGVTYGPFSPSQENHGLPPPARARADLDLMAGAGINALRLYESPPGWFLDDCAARQLHVMATVSWTDHVDFLTNRRDRQAAIQAVRRAARELAPREEVFALLVGNEIRAGLVRYLGPRHVTRFLGELIDAARQEAPETLISYASYPSTEYLVPEDADFTAFNVYLEHREAFRRYLSRLQNVAGNRPLVISEFGVDSRRHGQAGQAEILGWQREEVLAAGVAGNFIFAFTDEWFRGTKITDWQFGLVDQERRPKAAWPRLPPLAAPSAPDPAPLISVIVCTRNGASTLNECLSSLERLRWPNREIIVVDDGSTDGTREIIQRHPSVICLSLEPSGLGIARNAGAAQARGEILAYTDDDCVADPDWLHYLALAFADESVGAAGGPNIPPPPQNLTQACVAAAPGGPAHVLLGDVEAEHLPGCNLAVRRRAFENIGGFCPLYHAAGDDVDFCWRLHAAGFRIIFQPAAMVWHYRRFHATAYLRQQAGYGKAEALLMAYHGEKFGSTGGAHWRGFVYDPSLLHAARHAGRIYAGQFGHAPFQRLYGSPPRTWTGLATSFPWFLLAVLFLANGVWLAPLGALGIALLAGSLVGIGAELRHTKLPRLYRTWPARFLLGTLLALQPLVRDFSRFRWRRRLKAHPSAKTHWSLPGLPSVNFEQTACRLAFASTEPWDREKLLPALSDALTRQSIPHRADDGWQPWDLETRPSVWWTVRILTVTEYHDQNYRLTRVSLITRPGCLAFALHGGFILTLGSALFSAFSGVLAVLGSAYLLAAMGLEMDRHRSTRRIRRITCEAASASGTAVEARPPES